jgi:hypothetical protein
VLLDRFIPQKWISASWSKLGGGRVVWIERAKVSKVARYLSKYLTKELLLSAPKGTRRITCSRSIKLFPKWVGQHTTQEIVKQSVWSLLSECKQSRAFTERNPDLLHRTTLEITADSEGYTEAFEIVEECFASPAPVPLSSPRAVNHA